MSGTLSQVKYKANCVLTIMSGTLSQVKYKAHYVSPTMWDENIYLIHVMTRLIYYYVTANFGYFMLIFALAQGKY